MAEPRFLLVRLGSLGDIVHALPAAAALRDTFPGARIDWIVDSKWEPLLEGNSDLSNVISLKSKSASGISAAVWQLRTAKYTHAIDFQGLYKSALLAFASGAPRPIGFQRSYAREGFASFFFTDRLNLRGAHKVDHNLTLAERAGARIANPRFSMAIRSKDDERVSHELTANDLREYFVLNPGGGWRSKCWPAERYGELHRQLAEQYNVRGVVTFGRGEEELAQQIIRAAGNPAPVALQLELGPLMAALRRAKFVISADTGPLHLASALKTPVAGLFGPTDPARNGPCSSDDVVVRKPHFGETTYRRGASYSPAMLSISVDQVVEAVQRRLRIRS